jgi:ABC-2 type transport system permease protein
VIALPLVVTAILRGTVGDALTLAGDTADGAAHVVPGQAVMFSFLLTANIGVSFYRDHGWRTWDRLRASTDSPTELLVGKIAPWAGVALAQYAGLFALGQALFGFQATAAIPGLALVTVPTVAVVTTFAVALVGLTSSMQRMNNIANLTAITLGALGGALVPVHTLPDWAQTIAPATPTYWSMRGYRALTIDGQGMTAAVGPALVLLAYAAALAVIATIRLRLDDPKSLA